jgi:hypothetical protein
LTACTGCGLGSAPRPTPSPAPRSECMIRICASSRGVGAFIGSAVALVCE